MITRSKVSTRRLKMLVAALMIGALPQAGFAEATRQEDASLGKELKLPICQWSDSSVPTKGMIVAVHGVTLYAKRFDSVAKSLASHGYPVYAMDLRGFGRWRNENEKFGGDNKIHYTQSQGDLVEVLSALRRMYPDIPVYMMGESLGANMSVWAASTHSDLIDGIILSSPCVKRIVRLNGRVMIDSAKGLVHPFKPFQLEPHIEPYLSEDPRVTEGYLNDPGIEKDLSPADLIKSVRTNSITLAWTKKIPEDLPVLILAGEQDKIYKAKAIPKFAKKIPSKQKTVYMFEDKGHLLLEHDYVAPDVQARIDNWLEMRQKRDIKKGTIAENDASPSPVFGEGGGGLGTGDSGTSQLAPAPASLMK